MLTLLNTAIVLALLTLLLQAAYLLGAREKKPRESGVGSHEEPPMQETSPNLDTVSPRESAVPTSSAGRAADAEDRPSWPVGRAWARTSAGWLTLCLAAIGTLGSFMLLTNKLVIAPEFRLILVEGMWHCGLRLSLILVCLAAALLVRSARANCDDAAGASRWPLVIAALGGSLGAALCVQPVKSGVLGAPPLYGYPIFYPPFTAFLAWSLMEWSLAVFGFRSSATRAWISMLGLTAIAAFAWTKSSALPSMAACTNLWSAVVYFCLGRAIYLLAKKLIGDPPLASDSAKASGAVQKWAGQIAAPFLGVVVAAVTVILITGVEAGNVSQHVWNVRNPRMLSVGTGLLCIVTIAVHVMMKGLTQLRHEFTDLYDKLPKGLAALLFAWGFSDLLWWRRLGTAAAIALALVALAIMVEFTADIPLSRVAQHSFARRGWSMIVPTFRSAYSLLREGAKKTTWVRGLGLLVLAYYLQTAWYQRNALLIEELDAQALGKEEEWLGRSLASHVAHEVKRVSSLMNADSMHRSVLGAGTTMQDESLALSEIVVDDGEDVMGGDVESSVIKLGEWEVPIGMLLAPLRRPMRGLLRTRLVHGSIEHHDDQYLLLATVDGWGSFHASGTSPANTARLLGTRLFIAQSRLRRLGLSDDHTSAQAFFRGMDAWRRYRKLMEAGGGEAELRETIQHFSQAVLVDPTSAAAQYRLGIALWEDNQVVAAADAFNSAMRARPELAGPYIAQAKMLLRVGSAADRGINVATREPSATVPLLGKERLHEAERLLLRALSLPELTRTEEAAARLQYCALMTRQARKAEGDYYRAFYNCSRADVLYAVIASDEKRRAQRAVSAHLRARILLSEADARKQREQQTPWQSVPKPGPAALATTGWSCAAEELQWADAKWTWRVKDMPGARQALRWARAAVALEPDDPSHLCLEARIERALKRPEKMAALQRNPAVQARLAQQLRDRAWREKGSRPVTGLFESALEAYGKALQTSGSNPMVINDIAYAFRLWSVAEPHHAMRTARTALDTTRGIRSATKLFPQHPPQRRALWASTLGEVLIAQGFFHAAVEVLSQATRGAEASYAGAHNELHWDLAQATLCAQVEDALALADGHQCGDAAASASLRRIRELETVREFQPFSSWRFQDTSLIRRNCPLIPALPSRTDVIHLAPELRGEPDKQAEVLKYRFVIPPEIDGTIMGPVGLHLWNGVGQEIESELEAAQGNYISLSLPVPDGVLKHDPVLLRAHWQTMAGERRSTEPLSVYPCSEKGCASRMVVLVDAR